MKNTKIATINGNANEFYAELGKLIVKYMATIPPMEEKPDVKEIAQTGIPASAKVYDGTEEDYEILNRVVSLRPEIRLRNEEETYTRVKRGVLCCENTALWIIHQSADSGKLFGEVLDVAIDAHLVDTGFGLSAPTLTMIWRVLALHRYNHNRVRELLIEILRKNTPSAITVLAKATERYTQRSEADQRVMYIEDLLDGHERIRKQM